MAEQLVNNKFYHVQNKRPWGDYGRVLVAGMSERRDHDPGTQLEIRDSPLIISRTGPFVPPITLPDDESLVCTDDCRNRMEADLGTRSLQFRSTVKQLIVDSDWEDWDLDDDDPWEYPKETEPENYVIGQPHSPTASEEMGALWELVVPFGGLVDTEVDSGPWPADYYICVHTSTWNGNHIFLANRGDWDSSIWLLVSEDGKEFLDQYGGEWLVFEDCLTI